MRKRNSKLPAPKAVTVQPVVRRQRRCQWMTALSNWNDCGEVATHVRTDCGLAYCQKHAEKLQPYVFLEALPLNRERSAMSEPLQYACDEHDYQGFSPCPTCKAQSSFAAPSGLARWWIAERCCWARNTILVEARSKAEAQAKLDAGEGEITDVSYYAIKRARVIREDKAPNAPGERPPTDGVRTRPEA